MPWYCYLALKQLFPSGKRISFFAVVAVIGVMLGVMVLVVVQSVMNGFSEQIKETIRDTTGDIRITTDGIIRDSRELENILKTTPFVQSTARFAEGMLMLKYKDKPFLPAVRGIVPEEESQVVPIDKFIIEGNLLDLDDESVIIASSLSEIIGATIDSTIEVYTPLMLERMKDDEVILPRELKVVGIYETGYNKVDSRVIIVSLRLMQELYGMGQGIHGITVKLTEGTNAITAANTLSQKLPDYKVSDWLRAHDDFFFILRLEKTMMFFIMLFIILVASFSIASSLMTAVIKKTREIGLLAALGARNSHVAACFCVQGLLIGVLGTFLGCIGGITAIHFRNDLIHFITNILDRQNAMIQSYGFADIPARFMMSDFIVISICAITIATLAGVLPAIRASRMKPSEALRSE